MPGVKLIAIQPRTTRVVDAASLRPRLQNQLRNFAVDMIEAMAKYPSQEPTDYVRTGNLGRQWKMEPKPPSSILVYNNATSGGTRRRRKTARKSRTGGGRTRKRAYAVYVQGPKEGPGPGTRQTAVMREKGWQNITDESQRVWNDHRPAIVRTIIKP